MSELKGRTALVTGAGRGIGRAIALELARAGAEVVVLARNEANLAETVRLADEEGGVARLLVADISRTSFLGGLREVAPRVDVLVNNAAAFATYGYLESVAEEEIDRVLAVGLRAALGLVRYALPGMKERGFGRIVNIGSVAGSLGAAGQVAYSTAKAGLVGLTRAVAAESSRRGVTSNLLELGLVATERVEEAIDPEIRALLVRNTPVGRAGSAEEVARAVAFLASPAAGYVNGAVLPVSGGLGLGLFPEQLR